MGNNVFVVNDPRTELEIARFVDDKALLPTLSDIVTEFVRSGSVVSWRGPGAMAVGVSTPTSTARKTLGTPVKAAKHGKAGKGIVPEFTELQTVWINQRALNDSRKVKLALYAGKRGEVRNFQRGAGISKTIGVLFENQTPGDDLIWLAASELQAVPPGEL